MLVRRIIAVSPDKAFGMQLATALKAAGRAVDVYQTLASLATGKRQAALCVMHLDGDLAGAANEILACLTDDCRVIAIFPHSNLAAVVDLLLASDRVAGMMIAEGFDPIQFVAMSTRILTGDIFGLARVMASGSEIHTMIVGDYLEKSLCMSKIAGFVEQIGAPRRYRASIEQCIDEMLMNGLYDAPVDAHGNHIFSGVPTKTRITLRVDQNVVVQYAYDGKRFAVSVRDEFGSLERKTVLRYLHKSLHDEQKVDRKAGGAGLGLYLMVNSATNVYFNVVPGVATEALCAFDLAAPRSQLEQFGFFVEPSDATGRLATSPSFKSPVAAYPGRMVPPPPRGLVVLLRVLYAAIALMIVLFGIVAWPRIFPGPKRAEITFTTIPKGATIEIDGRTERTGAEGTLSVGDLEIDHDYPVVARLEGYVTQRAVVQPHDGVNELTIELHALVATVDVDTQPTGAVVEIDGKPMGSTPLTLTSLVPGSTVSIVFKRTGYLDATARVQVPALGEEKRLSQPLKVSDKFVSVRFVSNPAGALIVQNGQAVTVDRTYTPAELFVEVNKVQRFMLTMPNHVPLMIEPFTPGRGARLEKGGDLVEGKALRIEASLEGKVTVSDAPHCKEVGLPASCTLAPGTYVVEYLGSNNAPVTHTVTIAADAAEHAIVKFELGFVEAGPGKLLQPGGLRRAAFEVGTRTLTVSDERWTAGRETGTHTVTVVVTASATVIAN